MKSFLDYLSGVRAEMTHVKWPTVSQAIGYTALVIGISIFVAAYLGVLDYILTLVAGRVF
ncbi:preprotein translocase subunit SecE [Candidatus Kaiserbacteria bacterium CG10_big_fil_rev_8_21_14_0_10_45_20]|uniref:Protein translocase subunit SecE n=1 Tax=Candidatus Kaiserbacteria bacterium CG10_big_fil_rev_8_21_14_0_10_45_20 TaxID=1974607 RepID=A0A2H0UF54_9BACT|nr:MAG: preprotein translocase subunit SecE [Candidatus Kaiserbacteria bacterium CG10_big_fil_rev_8_21_14_0_10_45_20]